MTAVGADPTPITVFLLEDHDLVRRSVAQLLEVEPDMSVVGESATVAGALDAIEATHPRVAMLDMRLQDGSGIDVCRDIRAAHPDIRCIMLTSFVDDRAVLDAALAGASGFVLKKVRDNDIVRSIRQVASGATMLDRAAVLASLARMRDAGRDEFSPLTDSQRDLLTLIGLGQSNAEIAAVLETDIEQVRADVAVLVRRLQRERRKAAPGDGHDETNATSAEDVGL